jgi:hypothetical protein
VKSLAFHANQKDETELANLDFISSTQFLILDSHPIHIGAVETAHILHAPAVSAMSELRMTSTDGYIVKKHITLFSAPNNDYLATGR